MSEVTTSRANLLNSIKRLDEQEDIDALHSLLELYLYTHSWRLNVHREPDESLMPHEMLRPILEAIAQNASPELISEMETRAIDLEGDAARADHDQWMELGEKLRANRPQVFDRFLAEIEAFLAIANPTADDEESHFARLRSIGGLGAAVEARS